MMQWISRNMPNLSSMSVMKGVLLTFLILVIAQSPTPVRAFSYTTIALNGLGEIADIAQSNFDYPPSCPWGYPCHGCMTTECTVPAQALSKGARMTINNAIDYFEELVEDYIDQLKMALTKLANQGSNETQNYNNSFAAMTDSMNTTVAASAIAQSRVSNAISLVPSASACRLATRDRVFANADILMRVGNGGVGSGAMYTQSQRDATDYAANRPGGPSGNGALQASKNTFEDSMKDFCDNNVIKAPSGMSCTLSNDRDGQSMAFRFAQPYSAVFGVKDNFIPSNATDPENRAARLFVRFAVEPVPTDSIRGPILARSDGRSSYLVRQSDIAAINLARGALDHMVDDRIADASLGPGPNGQPQSLQSIRMLVWTDMSMAIEDAKYRARQPLGSNYDDLSPLVGEVNKIYLQLFNNIERLTAIKATRLARLVKQNSAGGPSVSTRTIRN